MLVIGVAPILAPILGGQLLEIGSWRVVFVALTVIAAVVVLAALAGLRETLPPERRDTRGVVHSMRTLRRLTREREFMGFALSSSLAFAAVFAYISGSSFVLQDVYGVSPQLYSVIFGVNGIGLIAASQVNARLVGRLEPEWLLRRALVTIACAAIVLLAVVSAGGLGAWAVMVPLFVIVSAVAFVLPNASALALADHPHVAGAASALLGVIQFLTGAVVAPLVGVAGTDTAVPMALVMSVLGVAAVATLRVLAPARPARTPEVRS
jgi:DHA1 family bicyclomycin/chloramphenicol resistance-like MFS transporter